MKMKNIFVLLAAITLVACSSNSNLSPSSSITDNSTTSGEILEKIKELADAQHVPYQSLISSVLFSSFLSLKTIGLISLLPI